MQISRTAIRALVESILLEGPEDDLRSSLGALYPDLNLRGIPFRGLTWLVTRFGKSTSRNEKYPKETHPIGDTLETVRSYFEKEKDKALKAKYDAKGDNPFRANVDERFPPSDRKWDSPADSLFMTADEMEIVLTLATDKKGKLEINVSEEEMESDRVGKVGPWNIWMPTTRERSCKIAQYDPDTKKPKTTWCTARMAGSNLFYNYIGRPGNEMTLFYIIRDNPSETEHWLSLGFINGRPQMNGADGMMSVDRENKGMTEERYRSILGPDYEKIMSVIKAKNDSLGGVHPAREKISTAAKSLNGLRYLLQGLNDEDAQEIKGMVAADRDASEEVLKFLSHDKLTFVKAAVAGNKKTKGDILVALAQDPSEEVKVEVISNDNTPGHVLEKFKDFDWAQRYIAANRSTPEHVLREYFEENQDTYVRQGLAKNLSTPPDILDNLTRYSLDGWTQASAASNPSTPRAAKDWIIKMGGFPARQQLAYGEDTPPDILAALSEDPEENIRVHVAENENTPIKIIRKMAESDPSDFVKSRAQDMLARKDVVAEARLRRLIRYML